MARLVYTLIFFAIIAPLTSVWAIDLVYIKGKKDPIKGVIDSETPRFVTLDKGKTTVKSEDIDDVYYDAKNEASLYKSGFLQEKDSLSPTEKKRKEKILGAIKAYKEVHDKNTDKYLRRHLEFKLGALQARLAIEEGDKTDAAIAKLKDYLDKAPSGWQIPRAVFLLARFQLDNLDYTGAEKTYLKLLDQSEVPDELKDEAELQAALMSMKRGDVTALGKMSAIASDNKRGGAVRNRARIYEAEAMVEAKRYKDAIPLLRTLVKDTSDRGLKAAAYNTLGLCYLRNGQAKEARWEFLWVDVVYNQDRGEHAKALYYLTEVFESLNDAEKAQECRETLLNDKTLAGTEFNRLMEKKRK